MMQFDKDMNSPHQKLFIEAREILLSHEGVVETKKQRITTYSNANGGICHMRTMPHGIDIGFLKGAKFEDQNCVLTGNGKIMRILPLSKVDKTEICHFMAQAIAIVEKK